MVLRYRLLPETRRVGNDLSAVNVGGQTPVNLMWRIAGFHWFGLWGKASSPDEVFRRLMPGDSIHWIRRLFQSCQPGRVSTNPSGSGLRRHVMTRPRCRSGLAASSVRSKPSTPRRDPALAVITPAQRAVRGVVRPTAGSQTATVMSTMTATHRQTVVIRLAIARWGATGVTSVMAGATAFWITNNVVAPRPATVIAAQTTRRMTLRVANTAMQATVRTEPMARNVFGVAMMGVPSVKAGIARKKIVCVLTMSIAI